MYAFKSVDMTLGSNYLDIVGPQCHINSMDTLKNNLCIH